MEWVMVGGANSLNHSGAIPSPIIFYILGFCDFPTTPCSHTAYLQEAEAANQPQEMEEVRSAEESPQ